MPGHRFFNYEEPPERPEDPAVRRANLRRVGALFKPYKIRLAAVLALIVLSADRPPELRDTGAGQTIDQIKLFGDAAKWFVEVGNHDGTPEAGRWFRRLACRAVWTAQDGRPGVTSSRRGR